MRQILGKLGSKERHTFQANFGKYGYKRYHDMSRGYLYSPTMVVRNLEIVDDPEHPKMITDHLWLNLTKGFAQLGLLMKIARKSPDFSPGWLTMGWLYE